MPTRNIAKTNPLHQKLLTMLSARVKLALSGRSSQVEAWSDAEDQVVAYVPESISDAKRKARREAGEPVYTTLSIPYTYAQVMAAHTYWTSVFFARTPVHQFSGVNGEGEMQIQALEALIDYQVQIGDMVGPYYIWLYDAAKYGHGVLGEAWQKTITQYTQLVETPILDPLTGRPTGQTQKEQVTNQVTGYEGNKVYNLSVFDWMHDPRVPIGRYQEGEFCIAMRSIAWHDVLARKAQGYYMNLDDIRGSGRGDGGQKTGSASSSSLMRPDDGQNNREYESGFGEDGTKPARIFVYEIYIKITQKEWGLGPSEYPEIWVFTITQDLSTIIGVEPLGLMHGRFPFSVAQVEVEAYGAYTRGIPAIMESIQDTMDWLLNSHFFNVRAALNNQFVGDPSKIRMSDVNVSGQPGFFFRLRPEAYGTDTRTVLTQVPVSDVTRAHMSDLAQMQQIGERVLGINDTILGAIAGSGRHTATEVRNASGFGVSRLKTVAEYMSATAFAPHSRRLVQNSQQLFSTPMRLRIVGSAAQLAGPQFMQVTPQAIAGFYDFVPVDGTLPIDRLAQANLWKEILLSFRFLPQLAQQYDLAKIFAYTAQVGGLKNINQFRVQLGDPGVLALEAQKGNVVPMRGNFGASGAPNSATQSGLNSSLPVPKMQR